MEVYRRVEKLESGGGKKKGETSGVDSYGTRQLWSAIGLPCYAFHTDLCPTHTQTLPVPPLEFQSPPTTTTIAGLLLRLVQAIVAKTMPFVGPTLVWL
ncbi:hypothetical protein V6N13_067291 [Hibiscus sabdariffa]|uniref:Uncharacterized protein n=1 Tax=Hibiscus sabdariffa TaxID=183260 RepID=A0ABR2DT13_9ROSI